MKISTYKFAAAFAAIVVIITVAGSAFSQGKRNSGSSSRGSSSTVTRGNSSGADRGNTVNRGRPDDRGTDDRRADDSRRNGSERRGKPDNNDTGNTNRFRGLSKQTGLSQDSLRNRFETEKALNSDLTYGQFVAANMIARNNKNVSADGILEGLRNGDSIGRTLHLAGMNEDQIKSERKRINKAMKNDGDFQDRDGDWRTSR